MLILKYLKNVDDKILLIKYQFKRIDIFNYIVEYEYIEH